MIHTLVPRWQVQLDDRTVSVTLDRSLLHGPRVHVDGREVPAAQEPPWNRVPQTPERRYSFPLGSHSAEIIERHTDLGVLGTAPEAWYELSIDGSSIDSTP